MALKQFYAKTVYVRHYFSVQSNQFCAVQDEKLCCPKITKLKTTV